MQALACHNTPEDFIDFFKEGIEDYTASGISYGARLVDTGELVATRLGKFLTPDNSKAYSAMKAAQNPVVSNNIETG